MYKLPWGIGIYDAGKNIYSGHRILVFGLQPWASILDEHLIETLIFEGASM